MYDDILVPIDGSEPSDAALAHAEGLAQDQDATVHVAHAVELPRHGGIYGRLPGLPREEVQALTEDLVSNASEDLAAAGIDTESVILDGLPHETIPDYADDHDVDLIVMGTHSRTGLERVVVGSTTEWTLREAEAPVLAVES